MKTFHTAVATATDGGRNGHTRTGDAKVDFEMSMPEAVGGKGGGGTSRAQDDAEALVAKAHERCPYSNATRGNIPVELAVLGGAAVSARPGA